MSGFDGILHEMFVVCGVLCIPVLVVAAAVGTTIALLQAATQVQEQTLTLLPKLIAVGLFVAIVGPFAMHLCAQLFHDAIRAIPTLAF